METIRTILIGISQIFLQRNTLSGALIVIGMYFSHPALCAACLFGSLTGTLTARLMRFPENEISQGLYGFNAGLAMMCILFTFGLNHTANPAIWLLGIFSAALTVPLVRLFLRHNKPALTFPFVAVCWVVCGLTTYYGLFGLTQNTAPLPELTTASSALFMPFYAWAEVNFGSSPVTGLLLLAAIAINSPGAAMWATASAVFAAAIAHLLFGIEPNLLANGLYSYSAILVACMFYGKRPTDFYYALAGVLLTVPIQYLIAATGLPPYTFGFIAAVWIMLFVQKAIKQYKYLSNHIKEKGRGLCKT